MTPLRGFQQSDLCSGILPPFGRIQTVPCRRGCYMKVMFLIVSAVYVLAIAIHAQSGANRDTNAWASSEFGRPQDYLRCRIKQCSVIRSRSTSDSLELSIDLDVHNGQVSPARILVGGESDPPSAP